MRECDKLRYLEFVPNYYDEPNQRIDNIINFKRFYKNNNEKSYLKFGIDTILGNSSSTDRTNQVTQPEILCKCRNFFGPRFAPSFYSYFGSLNDIVPIIPPPLYSTSIHKCGNFIIKEGKSTTELETKKRKRIWSRAVFSKLQRKSLEKRFQIQKYIMKPDRKQLAETLGLTDAQVKVWFQNRRMKWRNKKENRKNSSSDSCTNKTNKTINQQV